MFDSGAIWWGEPTLFVTVIGTDMTTIEKNSYFN